MALTTTGSPFSLNIPSASSDLADLFGSYLVPNMTAVNTYAAHKATAQTFSALQTFSAGLNVTAGNVGIGTTSPGYALDVSGDIRVSTGLYWAATDKKLYVPLDGCLEWFTHNSASDHSFAVSHQGAKKVVLNTNGDSYFIGGNVGIGTSSTTGLLTVAGDVHLSPTSGNPYIVIAAPTAGNTANIRWDNVFGIQKWRMASDGSGTSYRFYLLDANDNDGVYIAQNATTWTANSDSRLKDVKETITNALDKVNQLTGVKYTWKRDADNPDAKTRVGLIAQDVLAVLPEAVDDDTPELVTDEETGKVSGGLGVRYTELVPLLVNAIKELAQRVEALEA